MICCQKFILQGKGLFLNVILTRLSVSLASKDSTLVHCVSLSVHSASSHLPPAGEIENDLWWEKRI